MVLQRFERNAEAAGLPGFKKIRCWHFSSDIPTIENGLLTSTSKPRRYLLYKKFENKIKEMYSANQSKLATINSPNKYGRQSKRPLKK